MNFDISLGNIVSGVIAGVFAVAAIIISNRLTFRRTSSEKIWELRRQAYGEVLAALSQVENVLNIAADYLRESEDQYYFSKVATAHDTRILELMTTANKRLSDNYIVLSERFISQYEAMQKELAANDDPNQSHDESHAVFDATIRKHRPLLLAIARSEVLKAKTT